MSYSKNLPTRRILWACAVLGWSVAALADSPSSEPVPAPGDRSDESERVKEATLRFERALALFDDGDLDAALVEFNRAYELSPTYKILYNIGTIERIRNDYSNALVHFERYLREGGSEIGAERRAEVEQQIGVLRSRVAKVRINANVDGAALFVDDVPICGARSVDPGCRGTTPLVGPILVNPGTRKITAKKRGYQNADVQVTVAGGDQPLVELDLFDLKPRLEDTGPRTRAIISWGVTGTLAVGAGVMGVLTLGKKSQYDADRDKAQCENQRLNSADCNRDTFATLESDKKKTKTFALVTDALSAAAVLTGGISIYLTVKATKKIEPERDRASFELHSLRVSAAPGGAFVNGSF